MKTRIVIAFIALLSIAGTPSFADGIEFIHDKKFQELLDMAKAQKRSTREIRKPKADKNKTTPVVGLSPGTQVNALMNKPKAKA